MEARNRYELLKVLKAEGLYDELVAQGVISLTTANWLDVYEHYRRECFENQKTIAVQFVGDFWNVSPRNVYRIINYFES